MSSAIKHDFCPYIQPYTSTNGHFEHGYPFYCISVLEFCLMLKLIFSIACVSARPFRKGHPTKSAKNVSVPEFKLYNSSGSQKGSTISVSV